MDGVGGAISIINRKCSIYLVPPVVVVVEIQLIVTLPTPIKCIDIFLYLFKKIHLHLLPLAFIMLVMKI